MPSPTPPEVTFERFEAALHERLAALGWVAVGHRFPVAAKELHKLDFTTHVKALGRRTFAVTVKKGDKLVREQLRYLSDQYYNALALEKNEIKVNPTLIRGICIFAYERTPDQDVVGFLMNRVRPRSVFTPIRSLPWVFDLASGRLQRPSLMSRPFQKSLLDECVAAARTAGGKA